MLHVAAICADKYSNKPTDAALKPLAKQLNTQLWGLLPGFHRLVFENGQVLLTLCIGNAAKILRQLQFEATSIDLNSALFEDEDALYSAKAIARLCQHCTVVTFSHSTAMQTALRQCGFLVDGLQATYKPSWVTKKRIGLIQPSTCAVIGAGLAGAAIASSLARRGWAVTVLDAASKPASGASGLPAGLLVPHTSPDDSPLSRLSRCGVRMTLEQAGRLLQSGQDWNCTGVLELSADGVYKKLPATWAQDWANAADCWSRPAATGQLLAAGLPTASAALWHAQAGWVKPAALVRAWLTTPGVTWRGNAQAAQLRPAASTELQRWQVVDAAGELLAEAHMVVMAAGFASQALAATASTDPLTLQPIRGQVSWGLHAGHDPALKLPGFPVNGHGGFLSAIPSDKGAFWLMGATYQRDERLPETHQQDNDENFRRLQVLLPQVASALSDQFNAPENQAWAGIRCATPNRLPLLRQLDSSQSKAPLWICTGLGSRGLTFAALCGELLAAYLHGEPLPVDRQLADALMGRRF